MNHAHPTAFDYATSLPVSPRAQLAWLFALQCMQQGAGMPDTAAIAAALDIDGSQARRIVTELIGAGEFHRERPGVLHLVAV
jgi:hypothetical protein